MAEAEHYFRDTRKRISLLGNFAVIHATEIPMITQGTFWIANRRDGRETRKSGAWV